MNEFIIIVALVPQNDESKRKLRETVDSLKAVTEIAALDVVGPSGTDDIAEQVRVAVKGTFA